MKTTVEQRKKDCGFYDLGHISLDHMVCCATCKFKIMYYWTSNNRCVKNNFRITNKMMHGLCDHWRKL